MAAANRPVSRANMDPNYEKRCRDFQSASAIEAESLKVGGPPVWFRPEGWDGRLSGTGYLENMSIPFSSDASTNDYLEAVKDAKKPGTSGDVVITTIMSETLSIMERAFRVRHSLRRVRATCHVIGRKMAQGSATGSFIQSNVEFVRSLLATTKESPT